MRQDVQGAGTADLDTRIAAMLRSDLDLVSNPFPLYRDLLRTSPVHVHGPTVVVSRYTDTKIILHDAVTFSNQAYKVGSRANEIRSKLRGRELVAFDEVAAFESMYISRADGEQHARLRSIAKRAFTPRKMAQLQTQVQRYTDQLIDDMLRSGQNDIVEGLTSRLPTMMICSLLDVPLTDIDLIRNWVAKIGKNRGGTVIADLLDAHTALMEFRAYVEDVVREHRRHPARTDLVSALQGATSEARLSTDELLATMVVLLFGGSDTTTALLGNGLHGLLTYRDQWELLRSDPDRYLSDTVEELLRWVSPVQTLWRVTTAPTRIGELDVSAGTTVLLLVGAANRDPAQFTQPDVLDITRQPREHIAFGYGPHYCIGTALARMEASTLFRTLVQRFPDLAIRDPDRPAVFRGNIQFRSISALEVDWGTR